jgi:hypothetical protein
MCQPDVLGEAVQTTRLLLYRKEEDINQRVRVAEQITHLAAFANWPHIQSPASFPTEQKLTLAKDLDVEGQERSDRMLDRSQGMTSTAWFGGNAAPVEYCKDARVALQCPGHPDWAERLIF